MESITLKCKCCKKQESGDVSRLPQFGFELMKIADLAGWKSAVSGSSVFVFCSDKCLNKFSKK